ELKAETKDEPRDDTGDQDSEDDASEVPVLEDSTLGTLKRAEKVLTKIRADADSIQALISDQHKLQQPDQSQQARMQAHSDLNNQLIKGLLSTLRQYPPSPTTLQTQELVRTLDHDLRWAQSSTRTILAHCPECPSRTRLRKSLGDTIQLLD